jgi:Cation transport ATPase
VKTIKFNIIISLLINLVAVILSVLGVFNPVFGAIVHNLGSILVILNASLLYDRKFN